MTLCDENAESCVILRTMKFGVICVWLGVLGMPSAAWAEEGDAMISAAVKDEHGFRVHTATSAFQRSETKIRVLQPETIEEGRAYPTVYVLPVESRDENRYGDGLTEILDRDLHNKHQAIFVAPTFSHLPWYADHPTDPAIRQESYLLQVVIPFVERTYRVAKRADGRYLLGFSKSGWGAWSLLLRHPDKFSKAAAWDAPLMMDRLGLYGSAPIFATQERFDEYRIDRKLPDAAGKLGDRPRLILTGYCGFRQHHERAHQLLLDLKIPHDYRDGPQLKHDWHSGWVEEAVELLLAGRESIE